MAITAKELRNKAGQLAKQQRDIVEKATDLLTPDQAKEFDALYDKEQEYMKQAEKLERIDRASLNPDTDPEIENRQTITKGVDQLNPEQRKEAEDLAMRSYLQTGRVPEQLRALMPGAVKENDDDEHIQKAMDKLGLVRATQTTTTSGGGYLIPRGFMAELEKAIKAYGGMWEAARIVRTTKGNTMDWPTVNDTNNKAYRISESTSAATSAQPVVFGQQQFEAYKYTSGLIQVPTELLQDAEFNIAAELIELLAERIWRGTNYEFTVADGSSKPNGILNAAAYGASGTNDTAIAYDDLVNLEHSVDPGYRERSSARWMFHDSVLKEIKKLKDSQNMPVWLTSMRDGDPARLFGKPYTINQDMPIFFSGNATDNDSDKSVLFGDFSKYIIRQVRDMRIVRLDERYAELDQTAFVVFLRCDGDLLNAGTNPIKYLRQATT